MRRFVIFFLFVTLLTVHSFSAQLKLPIKQELILKLNLSIKRLQKALQQFDKFGQNGLLMWQRAQLTKKYFSDVNHELQKYNNVIVGAANKVVGNKNVVFGDSNNLKGNNNWVITSEFKQQGQMNGDLLLSKWRLQLDRPSLILAHPRLAISFLDQTKNGPLMTYMRKNRKLALWNKQLNNITNGIIKVTLDTIGGIFQGLGKLFGAK